MKQFRSLTQFAFLNREFFRPLTMTALHNKRAANLTFNLKDPTLFEDYFKV